MGRPCEWSMNWGSEKQKSGSECLNELAGSLAPQPELGGGAGARGTAMRRVYNPIKAKIIFEVNHTLCTIEFAKVERRICMQRVSAVYIPKRHCTVNTLVSTDVYKFEQVARSIDPCRQCQYVAVCRGCSHVICEHNSVGIIATGSSPVSGLGSKPCKVCWADQVRLPIWVITADRIGIRIAGKYNMLLQKQNKQ